MSRKERNYNSEFANGFETRIGRLSWDAPKVSTGKKVFEWKFKLDGSDDVTLVHVSVENDAKLSERKMQFRARCDRFEDAIVDTDINNLHERVESVLKEQAQSISGIAWEDWFQVVVRGSNSDFGDSRFSALGANLHIQVNRLKRGVHPVTGKVLTINLNGVAVEFPSPTKNVATVSGPGEWLFDRQEMAERSYIAATPENRRALDGILERMAVLRSRLMEILCQENVQQRLDSIDTNFLLPMNGVKS